MTDQGAIESIAKRAKAYLPNSSDRLALVSLNDKRPFRAYWPLRLTQLVGGKTWSLSLVRYRTMTPVPVPEGIEDALAAARTAGRKCDWRRPEGSEDEQ